MSRKTRDELCHEVYAVLLSNTERGNLLTHSHSPSAFGHQPELGQHRRRRGSFTCITTGRWAEQGYACYHIMTCTSVPLTKSVDMQTQQTLTPESYAKPGCAAPSGFLSLISGHCGASYITCRSLVNYTIQQSMRVGRRFI
jgi:hypothetical protein